MTLSRTIIIRIQRTLNAAASGGGIHSIAPAPFGLTHKIAAVHPKLISNYLARLESFFFVCKN